jgi:hypothetical protein
MASTNLALTTDQLQKVIDRLNNSAGSLVRATQTVSEALLDTSDKWKKARIEDIVEKSAKKMGKSLDKADGGLLKYVKALNDQVDAYKNVQKSLKGLNSASDLSRKEFTATAQSFLKTAKENGELQKILGKDYAEYHVAIEHFLTDTKKSGEEVIEMAGIIHGFGDKFGKAVHDATKELEHFDQSTKSISMKEALGDALTKRGGIVGAITDSMRGSKGWANLTNFIKGNSVEMLITGATKAVQQLIDASNEYDKTGVAPLIGSSTALVMQMSDLQKIMGENKETIFALQGGATAFTDTMVNLRGKTMALAGKDPILSGKLAAGAMDLTTTMASTTLTTGEMQKRTTRYIDDITKMRKAVNMTAEEIENWDKQILDDDGIRDAMVKSTAVEREQILENIHARAQEFQAMGISIKRSQELAVSFEKLKKQSTPLQRLRGSVKLGMLASMIGMSSKDIATARSMSDKAKTPEEEKAKQEFLVRFGKESRAYYNALDDSSSMMAGVFQTMSDETLNTFGPEMKAFVEGTGTAATISGGKAQKPGAAETVEAKTSLQRGMLDVGEIAGYSKLIWEFLDKNGLKDLLAGGLGILLVGGFGSIIGALGTLITTMRAGGAAGAAEGAAGALKGGGALKVLGGVVAAGAVGWEIGQLINEHTGIQESLASGIDSFSGLDKKNANIGKTPSLEDLPPEQQAMILAQRARSAGATPHSPLTAPTHEDAPVVSGAATAGTGTTDPMQALLVLQQQSKKVLEEISKGIDSLLSAYTDTETQKMQRGTNNNGSMQKARAYER